MIYGKLPVVFLSAVASEKRGSTNSIIASFILDHREESLSMGIKELSEACHVSLSSVSRFCKDVGLSGFAELREILMGEMHFEKAASTEELTDKVTESIRLSGKTVDMEKIRQLALEMKNHKNVAAFGLLKAGTAAIALQSDMLMLGKQIYTNISYSQQMEYISSAGKDELIIIFSYTGSYFDSADLRTMKKQLKAPKIVMISGNRNEVPDFVDIFIGFDSRQDQLSHPWQLQFIASLIAQEYSKLI